MTDRQDSPEVSRAELDIAQAAIAVLFDEFAASGPRNPALLLAYHELTQTLTRLHGLIWLSGQTPPQSVPSDPLVYLVENAALLDFLCGPLDSVATDADSAGMIGRVVH